MSSDDLKKLKKKKLQDQLEDIAMGKAPGLQPKKIDGEWRYPLDMEIPDAHMTCPRCGKPALSTEKKTVEQKTIFKCKDCHIEFIQSKKARIGWCKKHNKKITGKECMGCHVFRQNIQKWMADHGSEFACPHYEKIDNVPEGFT